MTLDIDVGADGFKAVRHPRQDRTEGQGRQDLCQKSVDPEFDPIGPDGYYWSSEGDGKALLPPFVRVTDKDGNFLREFTLPDGFAPTADHATGIRDNLAFEDLTFLLSGDLLVGLEAALYQDGPAEFRLSATACRGLPAMTPGPASRRPKCLSCQPHRPAGCQARWLGR